MKIIETWKSMHTFQDQHHPIAMLVWLFSGLLSFVLAFLYGWEWANLWFPVAANIAITYLMLAMLSGHESMLTKRIEAGNAVPWQVDVNGVIVGTIADSDYAAIQRSVWLDVRTYLAQMFNVGNMLLRTVDMLFVAIPMVVFWYGLGAFFLAPDTFASILTQFRQVTPEQVAASVPRLLQMVALISMMFILVRIALGKSFGFVNCFEQAIGKRVRRVIGCAADGDVSIRNVQAATISSHPQKA